MKLSQREDVMCWRVLVIAHLVLLLATAAVCRADQWEGIGGSAEGGGISDTAGSSTFPAVAMGPDGDVAVAWEDTTAGLNVYLKQLQEGAWLELAGSGSGTGLDGYTNSSVHTSPSVVLDSQGRVLAAYAARPGGVIHLYFKRWNGHSWDELAGSGSGTGLRELPGTDSVLGTFVTFDGDDRPVVGMSSGNHPADDLEVFSWNGVSWDTHPFVGQLYSYFPAIARSPTGDFWLVCDNGDENGSTSSIHVYKYNGTSWEPLIGNLSADQNNRRAAVAVDSLGRPVVAWMSGNLATAGSYRVMVARWDGVSWSGLAGSDTGDGISDPSDDAGSPAVAIAEGDVPIVAYIQESSTSNWLCVKGFNGTGWTEFGDGSATEPGLGDGCADVVSYLTHPTMADGWRPYYDRKVSMATNSQGTLFCAWERASLDNIFGKVYTTVSCCEARIKVPNEGKRVSGNRVSVMAEIIAGLIEDVDNVLFQYRLVPSETWLNIEPALPSETNPDTTDPYFVHWNVSSLPSGTYELRAVATNTAHIADPDPEIRTVIIDHGGPEHYESVNVDGDQELHSSMLAAEQNELGSADPRSSIVVTLTIPSDALSSDTGSTVIFRPSINYPVLGAFDSDCNAYVDISLDNMQVELLGGKKALVNIHYPDTDQDGWVDGTPFSELGLVLCRHDGSAWVPLESSTVNPVTNTVQGLTTHFSPFGAIGLDDDGDGLSNEFEETVSSTDRTDSDTDGDGVIDYDEVGYDGDAGNYDPYDPDTNPSGPDLDANDPDTDGDGYSDGEEVAWGSDPRDSDSLPVRASSVVGLIMLCVALLVAATRLPVLRRTLARP